MKCEKCGNQIDDSMKYCSGCGSYIKKELEEEIKKPNHKKKKHLLKNLLAVGIIIVFAMVTSNLVTPKKQQTTIKGNGKSQQEIETYIIQMLNGKYDTSFEIKLKTRQDIEVCTRPFLDGACLSSTTVKNAYNYHYEIISSEGIVASALYYDEYTHDSYVHGSHTKKAEYNDNYLERTIKAKFEKEMIAILEKYTDKFMFENREWDYYNADYVSIDTNRNNGAYDIFINYNDARGLNNLINELDNCVLKYKAEEFGLYVIYKMYIMKDAEMYNSINYNSLIKASEAHDAPDDVLPIITGYEVQKISHSTEGFDKQLFVNEGDPDYSRYQDPKSFKHIVFCYRAESNSFNKKGEKNTTLLVFGLK